MPNEGNVYATPGQGMGGSPRSVLQALFQQGQARGTISPQAQADTTTASPPKQGGPPNPTHTKEKRELDNPNQYGKPGVQGPPTPSKATMRAPKLEDLARAIEDVREGGDPKDVARAVLFGKKKGDDDTDETEEDDDEEDQKAEAKKRNKKPMKGMKGAYKNGDMSCDDDGEDGESVEETIGVGTSVVPGMHTIPGSMADGPKFEPGDVTDEDLKSYVRNWLAGLPEAKKSRVFDAYVRRTGKNAYWVDGVTGRTLSLEGALQAILAMKPSLSNSK